jgi:hypothetical protein
MPQEPRLQEEHAYYLSIKPDLLKQSLGKFALIKDQSLAGVFDTDADAYKFGLEKFGNVPFLIIRIQEAEEKSWTPILQLGLINANP